MHTIDSNGDSRQSSHSWKKQRRHKCTSIRFSLVPLLSEELQSLTHNGTVVRELNAVQGMVKVLWKKYASNQYIFIYLFVFNFGRQPLEMDLFGTLFALFCLYF
jgi:hypothetical protein